MRQTQRRDCAPTWVIFNVSLSMIIRVLISVLCALCFAGCGRQETTKFVYEGSHSPLQLSGRISLSEFAFGGIGYAGVTSEGEKFLFHLMADRGQAGLRDLYQRGDAQAKAYALVGLRWLAAEDYSSFRADFLIQPGVVVTQSGCLVYHRSPAEIIAEIESGQFDSFQYREREEKKG